MRRTKMLKRRLREGAQRLVALNPALARVGLRLASTHEQHADPTMDFPVEWQRTISGTAAYTMVSPERTGALIQAVEHTVAQDIPGAFVECGVWKGGSSMAAALTLKRLGELRDVYLFDTFEGMSAPTEVDFDENVVRSTVEHQGRLAVGINEVREAMASTGYPMERVKLVKGKVEDTVPEQAPEQIAVLRLDTDFYESTRHELKHLYPRLSRGGVLIIDDYGLVPGARKAVDEFFDGQGVFLHRLDSTGRLVIRP